MEKKSFLSIYAKSFYWAGFFLPKETYLKCSNLYDFCRTLDNIADDEGIIDVKLRRFLNFKNNFINKEFQNPIIKNMWVLMDEYNISTKIVEDLFDGVESDIQNEIRLNSKKELLIAMQLTNISRDVIEDSKNKRFYIKHNFETIKETLATADLFYDSSFSSIKDIPLTLRFSILVARRVYRQIGRNIIKKQTIQNYNKSGKIFVSISGKILQTILSIFDLVKLSLIKKHNHLRDKEHELISEEINLNERF
jgi:phytoene synthase